MAETMPVTRPHTMTAPRNRGTGSGRARNVSIASPVSNAETIAIDRIVRLNQGRNGLSMRPVRIAAMNPAMNAQAIAASRSGKISSAHRIVPIESR
jgi:hypothetical protein